MPGAASPGRGWRVSRTSAAATPFAVNLLDDSMTVGFRSHLHGIGGRCSDIFSLIKSTENCMSLIPLATEDDLGCARGPQCLHYAYIASSTFYLLRSMLPASIKQIRPENRKLAIHRSAKHSGFEAVAELTEAPFLI